MSLMDLTESPWCERTQDMSGYVLPDSILPPLDEQFDFTFSTAQNENDLYVQNPGNLSPEDFIWEDHTDVLEDSNMFDNSNYSVLHTKMKEWLPNIPTTEIDEFAKTSMIGDDGDFPPHIDYENSLTFSEIPTVDIKPSDARKKPGYLSVFDNEEPYIKEDPDLLSCCTENKLILDPRDEMEVAEEVVVTTEEVHCESQVMFHQSPFLFGSNSFEFPIKTKEETIETYSPPSSSRSSVLESYNLMDFSAEEDIMFHLSSPPTSSPPIPKINPSQLHLDIEAAMVSSAQLLCGGLPDTPEVLKPVLKPGSEFDLVNFLLTNGDSNNNSVMSTNRPTKSSVQRLQERRRGKSHLTLSDLKACEVSRQANPSPTTSSEQSELTPRLTAEETQSTRPARRSATKFKKLIEEGLLRSPSECNSVSSDDEDSTPKSKRRRTSSSSSSRKRLNSDSDHSSVCGSHQKYRERRDRNNLSSKRSRQKRKSKIEQKKVELKKLEEENVRLRRKADQLAALLKKVHTSWQDYLVNMKKEDK